MNYGTQRPGLPTYLVAILATCGGCLLVAIVAGALLAGAAMNSAPGILTRAGILQGEKRYAEAEALLRTAAHSSPNDPMVLNDLAWTLYLEGKYSEGEEFAQRAVARDGSPSNVDTLAHCHLGLKKYAAAEKEFHSALAANPTMAESHDGLGQVYEQRGQLEKALDEYRTAVEEKPGIEGTRDRIARIEAKTAGEKRGKPPHVPESGTQ